MFVCERKITFNFNINITNHNSDSDVDKTQNQTSGIKDFLTPRNYLDKRNIKDNKDN